MFVGCFIIIISCLFVLQFSFLLYRFFLFHVASFTFFHCVPLFFLLSNLSCPFFTLLAFPPLLSYFLSLPCLLLHHYSLMSFLCLACFSTTTLLCPFSTLLASPPLLSYVLSLPCLLLHHYSLMSSLYLACFSITTSYTLRKKTKSSSPIPSSNSAFLLYYSSTENFRKSSDLGFRNF